MLHCVIFTVPSNSDTIPPKKKSMVKLTLVYWLLSSVLLSVEHHFFMQALLQALVAVVCRKHVTPSNLAPTGRGAQTVA